MPPTTQPGMPDASLSCLDLSEPCTAMDTSGGHAASTERTRPRRRTDETIDLTSTFIGSEKGDKRIDVQTLELQPSADGLLTLHPSPAIIDEEGRPTQGRVTFGRWQRIRLHWFTAYRVLIMFAVIGNSAAMIAKLRTVPEVEAPLTATAANIMTAVLLRQEELINFSFGLISRLPYSMPFFTTEGCTLGARCQHYSGISCSRFSTRFESSVSFHWAT
jgi:hypothetical protein